MFDKAVEVLILTGVWIGVYLEWQSLQEKRKTRIRSLVTRFLKSLVTTRGMYD